MRPAFAVLLAVVAATLAPMWEPASGGLLRAQTPIAPPAVLRGRVVAADKPNIPDRPLARARVTVIAGGQSSPPVYADDAGAFAMPFPASAQTVRVAKSGYVPIDIVRPPAATPLTIVMRRAAIVRGRVVDGSGDPSVGVPVRLRGVPARDQNASASASPSPVASITETDDRGEFRFGGLPAGRYAIDSARGGDPTAVLEDLPPAMLAMRRSLAEIARDAPPASETVTVDVTAGGDASLTLVQNISAVSYPYAGVGGVVTGTLFDEFGEPAEDVSVRLWLTRFVEGRAVLTPAGRSRRVDDTGRYRLFHVPAGRYLVVATLDPASETGRTEPEPFLPVYYPGRLEVGEAIRIDVARAQETPGIDMTVVRSRGARVFGVALSASGTRLGGRVLLVPSDSFGPLRAAPAAIGNGLTAAPLSAVPAAGGAFEIRNVPPGVYALQAVATLGFSEPAIETATINGIRRTVRFDLMHIEGITEFTMQRLAVNDGDVGPVALTTVVTSVVSGRVTVDGPGRTITPADFEIRAANVEQDEVPGMDSPARRATIERDGSFRLAGLTGRSLIVLTRAPPGWWLESADIGGLNAAEEPVAFGSPAESRDDVTIVLAPTGATLAGRIDDGEAAASVVVFPVARALRIPGSRYLRTTSADAESRYALDSLPPGDYYVIAVEEPDGEPQGQWDDPEALEVLAPLAQRVTMGERDTRTLDLRRQRLSR